MVDMKNRLNRKNAVYTLRSGTTVLINYNDIRHILEVEFINGDVYQYLHVPYSLWKEYATVIAQGGSSGIFLNSRIKPFYSYIKIS